MVNQIMEVEVVLAQVQQMMEAKEVVDSHNSNTLVLKEHMVEKFMNIKMYLEMYYILYTHSQHQAYFNQ